jgi:dephospho-CoA kinase
MPERAESPVNAAAALVIAVTGGIASGKSLFCRLLAREPDVRVLDADACVHALLDGDAGVREAVLRAFGDEVLDARGRIDRARLGTLAFDDPRRLRTLEAILHPRVRASLALGVERLKRDPRVAIVAVEIPLLAESGRPAWCDRVVAIEATRAVRLERLRARGWDEAAAARRMAQQADDERRRAVADEVIENEGDEAELARIVRERLRVWRTRGE